MALASSEFAASCRRGVRGSERPQHGGAPSGGGLPGARGAAARAGTLLAKLTRQEAGEAERVRVH